MENILLDQRFLSMHRVNIFAQIRKQFLNTDKSLLLFMCVLVK